VSEVPPSRPSRLPDLLHLAWPIVVARSAQVVVGFSDAVMVGRLGEA
jgi:Na+-driven multidrug efflux pump